MSKLDAGYAAVAPLPFFNVKDYGAVGDGVTDDTTAIHAVRDAAGPNGIVDVPSGTFLVTGLTFSVAGQMWRVSAAATIKLKNASNTHAITVSGANVTVQGPGTVDANGANQTSGNGVEITGDDVTIDNLKVINAHTTDIHGTDCNRARVRFCKVTSTSTTAGIYFQLLSGFAVDGPTIAFNRVDRSGAPSAGAGNGIAVHGNYGGNAAWVNRRPVVTGNTVIMPTGAGSQLGIECENGCPYAVVSGNTVTGGPWIGVSVDNSAHASVTGNTVTGFTQAGVESSASPYVTVTGNTVDGANAGTFGISLSSLPTHNTVSGNTVSQCTTYGITVTGSDHCITGNTVTAGTGSGRCIYLNSAYRTTVVGNHLDGASIANYGITFDTPTNPGDPSTVIGNTFLNLVTSAIQLTGAVTFDRMTVAPNTLPAVPLLTVNGGATLGNTMKPVSQSVGASPYTYTNNTGLPQHFTVTSGTVSSITKNGTSIGTATGIAGRLDQGDSLVITYTVAPTLVTDRA